MSIHSSAAANQPDDRRALYAGLLGSSWLQVAEPIRSAHASGSTIRARGRLRIAHGRGQVARFLARLLRLPRASEAAETRLVITSVGDGERWLRTFDVHVRVALPAVGPVLTYDGLIDIEDTCA